MVPILGKRRKLFMGSGLKLGGATGGASYPKFAAGSKLRIIGDSIFGRGHGGASPGDGLVYGRDNGSFEYALAANQRLNFEAWPTNNAAEQTGYTTTWVDGGPGAVPGSGVDFHETLVSRTLTMDPDIFAYSATINSRAVPNAEDRIIAIYNTMVANGIYVLAGILPPIGAGASFDDSGYLNRPRINTAIKNWVTSVGPSKAMLLDWDVVMDPGHTGYCTNLNLLLTDKVHIHPYGASVIGEYINSQLDLIMTAGPDVFDQKWAALTNYMPNPNLTGSGGSRSGSWASGSVIPAGYRGSNGTATWSTVISTVEANAGTGGQNLLLPITPVSGSADTEIYQFMNNVSGASNGYIANAALAGKWVVGAAEIEVSNNAYIGSPTVYCIDNFNSAGKFSRALDIDSNNGNTPLRKGKAETFKLITDPVKLDPASGGPRMQAIVRSLGAQAFAAGVPSMTVKIKRMALWDVGDPKPRWNM